MTLSETVFYPFVHETTTTTSALQTHLEDSFAIVALVVYAVESIYSITWIVSTLKGKQNWYSLSEVPTIQGVFNGIA
jgi:hypothetical protein